MSDDVPSQRPTPPAMERRVSRVPPIDTLDDAAEAIELLDARMTVLEVELAVERRERQQELTALREEWRNVSTAIAANSTALGNATAAVTTRLAGIEAEQRHQSGQLKLIGQAMELLLATEGIEMPRG